MSTTTELTRHGITLPMDRIADFCRRWKVRELAVFGSFLRDDFRDDSDIDLLIDPLYGVKWSFDDVFAMQDEMTALLGREAQIVERSSVEASPNYIRRKRILSTAVPIHVER